MTTSETQALADEHLYLAGIIKGVHKKLRREFRDYDGNYSSVWKNHLQNKDILATYACAMQSLAEQHWSVYSETRIDWCKKVILEYFLCDGCRKAFEKDVKRKYFEEKRRLQKSCKQSLSRECSLLKKSDDQIVCQLNLKDAYSDSRPETSNRTEAHDDFLYQPESLLFQDSNLSRLADPQEKIRLLDVGSCYNAFKAWDKFEAIGVDLCPANESVYQCDFLELQIAPGKDRPFPPLSSPVTDLPGSSFHVVVFSLLLEYLPSPAQRFLCCVKAQALLVMHGLFLIITPDSHSQHRNAPMIKMWRQCLETLGLVRWKYEKKEHIHCMAFRKVSDLPGDFNLDQATKDEADKMYIPQDFNDACYDEGQSRLETPEVDEAIEASNAAFKDSIRDELPLMFGSDDSADEDVNG